ncbi:hypothetical protein BN1012_Phect2296 [Candidatus Phaeomarinobacter ectocarpi]|uniref:Uncharacterized protein n=1 Tax=Candidatus Phaeomarinibacter ectocarpi TaxID=1458461 RepID=X5MGD1_9HYPH|nr:hypothetical protein BN1012_Phect2296 [Candidatus Phaeomarinobacter ectocarpi]
MVRAKAGFETRLAARHKFCVAGWISNTVIAAGFWGRR